MGGDNMRPELCNNTTWLISSVVIYVIIYRCSSNLFSERVLFCCCLLNLVHTAGQKCDVIQPTSI